MRNWKPWLLVAVGIVLAGCGQNKADTDAAVRRAIEEHLAGQAGLASSEMVMDLKKVDVQGDKAQADVQFRSRTDPKAFMDFHYQLHKEGRDWKVDQPNPTSGGMPHSMTPPSDGTPQEQMPPGAGGGIPEGHPPIGTGEQGPGNR